MPERTEDNTGELESQAAPLSDSGFDAAVGGSLPPKPELVSEASGCASGPKLRRATGPSTAVGKGKSKYNALQHGVFSKVLVLEGESSSEFEALLTGLREHLQPEGSLEDVLVEKLASLIWRHRRLILAESSEIQKGTKFLEWDEREELSRSARTLHGSLLELAGGLTRFISNPKIVEHCLEQLARLGNQIESKGFDLERDAPVLKQLYGSHIEGNWHKDLIDSYCTWMAIAESSKKKPKEEAFFTPELCIREFLDELDNEIKKLRRYGKEHKSIKSERNRLEALRLSIPDAPQADRLQRYEASLERNFDRTLSQLERLQRMRLGQPVAPKIEVRHSLS